MTMHQNQHSLPESSAERFEMIRSHLYTPVIGDILDQMQFTRQFLPENIRPLLPSMKLVGRAMPVLIADIFGNPAQPFGRMTEALDQLEPGEVYLARGGRTPCSAWGEILTATARRRGAAGAVLDGFHRDTPKIVQQDWPVFSWGSYGQDAGVRTVVVDYRVPVQIGQVTINPGDLLVGDIDGVVVIPRAVEDEVLTRALGKASTENLVLRAINGGMSSTEALASFGVL